MLRLNYPGKLMLRLNYPDKLMLRLNYPDKSMLRLNYPDKLMLRLNYPNLRNVVIRTNICSSGEYIDTKPFVANEIIRF